MDKLKWVAEAVTEGSAGQAAEACELMVSGRRIEKRRKAWSAAELLEEISKLSTVTPKAVQEQKAWLYGAAVRQFGSWREAVKAAGMDYDQSLGRRAPGFWDHEKVLSAIQALQDKTSGHVRRSDRGLYSAALRLFGSWEAAVTSAGFSYKDIVRGWLATDTSGMRFARKGN